MTAVEIPERIHRTDEALFITWSEDHVGRYEARALRLACHCAMCRDEMTGRELLDATAVPRDIRPLAVHLVGSYAIRIDWSDGHATGIYTYEMLRRLCPCDRCRDR